MKNSTETETKLIWKEIPFAENYMVSDRGDIYNKKYNKYLKGSINSNGYRGVSLSTSDKKYYYIHYIVAYTFLGNPDNLPTVNHKNSDRLDNSVENLEFSTWSENHKHAFRSGRKCHKGEKAPNHKLTTQNVKDIRNYINSGVMDRKKIASIYNVSETTIYCIEIGKTWKEVV